MKPSPNELFDKVYVLTIDRNADRHPLIHSMLRQVGFEFWNGFDAGASFSSKTYVSEIEPTFFIQHNVDRDFAISSTMGQFGAYLSIKKMIDHIAASNYTRVLIFEDDAIPIRADWEKILCSAVLELPGDWDILMAGYFYDGSLYQHAYNRAARPLVNLYNGLKKWQHNIQAIKKLPVKFSRHLDRSGYSTGGHAYCLSARGAKILSHHLNPMRESGDLLFSRLVAEEKINSFSVYPCLFKQNRDFDSKTEVIGLT